jgi:hypothetical protein
MAKNTHDARLAESMRAIMPNRKPIAEIILLKREVYFESEQ